MSCTIPGNAEFRPHFNELRAGRRLRQIFPASAAADLLAAAFEAVPAALGDLAGNIAKAFSPGQLRAKLVALIGKI
jgi:hypothetical protein